MKKFYFLICSTFLILQLSAQDTAKNNCLKNSFCSLSLCDNCSYPYHDIKIDPGIKYGKTNLTGYPGDVVYADENHGCAPGANACTKNNNNIL